MAFLEVNNIKKSFGKNEILKGISFDLQKGEVLSIIGSSGSGKTTLLRCINFLEFAEEGTVKVNGEVIYNGETDKKLKEKDLREKRLHFGLVFQDFNLFPQYDVLQNLTLAPSLLKMGTKDELEAQARKSAWKTESTTILASFQAGKSSVWLLQERLCLSRIFFVLMNLHLRLTLNLQVRCLRLLKVLKQGTAQ